MTTLPPPPALKPIAIGPVTIAEPVVLAPMTGVTDMPFRKVVRQYGCGLNVTEMIASQAMIRETRQSLQKAAWDPIEEPVSMQLAGCIGTPLHPLGSLDDHAYVLAAAEIDALVAELELVAPEVGGRELSHGAQLREQRQALAQAARAPSQGSPIKARITEGGALTWATRFAAIRSMIFS